MTLTKKEKKLKIIKKKGKENEDNKNQKIDYLIAKEESKKKNTIRNFYEKNNIDFNLEL